jgi:hypothetical protein
MPPSLAKLKELRRRTSPGSSTVRSMTSLGFSLNVYILQQKYSNNIFEVSWRVEIFEM